MPNRHAVTPIRCLVAQAEKHQHAFSWWTRTASVRVGDPTALPQFHTPRDVLLGMCHNKEWWLHSAGRDTNDVSKHGFTVSAPPAK